MKKLEMIYEGKAKKVYKTNEENIYLVEYKDDATALNGMKKGQILGKGIMNNKISAKLFEMLETKGIKTHYIERLNDREQLVKRVKIIPLEVLVRNVTAGSLSKRLGVEEGIKLKNTVLEFCLKDDALGDPFLNEDHIRAMEYATEEEVAKIKEMSLLINVILTKYFAERNINLIDFKLEFGKTPAGELILADEISPDTCRLWDATTNEKLDKDRFRRDLGKVEEGYQEVCNRIYCQVD